VFVPAFLVPDRLLANAGHDAGCVDPAWIAALPDIVEDFRARWSLRVGSPFEPGGRCSWTAPAVDEFGGARVLKIGWLHDEAQHEAAALRIWSGAGAVHLYASEIEGRTSALLLERCSPDTALGSAVREPLQDVIIAGLLRRLWAAPAPTSGVRPLEHMCDSWADQFGTAETKNSHADLGLVRVALELFRELPRTASRRVLLCTDLHAENVLSAQREPWLAIDPKPYVGDPTYDVLQHMLNSGDRLRSDPGGLCRRLAALLDLDAERLSLWLCSRAVLESTEQPWLWEVAKAVAP
jgi:streptomycin 6-kinase